MNNAEMILQAIILATSGWTLLEVIGMGRKLAGFDQWKRDLEKQCDLRHGVKK
jgi:hypothetical protein